MTDPASVVSLPHLEELAREGMPHMAYEFVASGAADEVTMRSNRMSLDALRLRQRVLRDVSVVDTHVTLLGREHALPLLLAPTSYHRVLHPEGELATARGAGAAGITWVVSTSTNTPLDEIARAAAAPLWFQLYIQHDREFTRDLVQSAEANGYEALVLTVDTPTIGVRDRQRRASFRLPPDVTVPHVFDVNSGKRQLMAHRRFVATWKDVEWLRGIVGTKLVLKGVLDADDAARAADAGADAVIVSNHGGRNFDGAPATIDALPAIADRLRQRVPLIVDGGIRRGTDIVKAIALGATAVMIGRPYCYALALAGAAGVTRVVELLRDELEIAMMMTGCSTVGEIDRGVLWD